eukprot:GFYU01004762.1.p1 GENE.GFYU01004762.1~~GFYU01004762.1.p1  ORF type:complete len:229 (-),score=86.00 GFYU01004762.1:106-792(-)
MKKFVAAALVAAVGTATAQDCHNPTPSTCNWYADCLEKTHPCGPDGYALSYGGHYCQKFHDQGWTGDLHTWMAATGDCLQHALLPLLDKQVDCEELTDEAFDSHPQCYLNNGSGVSICQLSLGDKWKVVRVLEASAIFSTRSIKQMWAVAKGCLSNANLPQTATLLALRAGEENCPGKRVAHEYAVWDAIFHSNTLEEAEEMLKNYEADINNASCEWATTQMSAIMPQ